MSGYPSYQVYRAGQRALRTIDVGSVLVAVAAIGLLRRSIARSVAAAALVFVSVGTVELLKHGLARVTHDPHRPPTWPSGHTAVAVSLGLALVLAAPPLLRPVAALVGAAYGAGIGLSVVVAGWHYPTDVLGAFFICGAWGCLAAALLGSGDKRPAIDLRGLLVALLTVAGALFVAAVVASAHPTAVAAARSSTSMLLLGAVIGLLNVALFAAYAPLVPEDER